jgi:hypothetical protein
MIRNLGKAISVLILCEVHEVSAHADVDAFGAPGECHRDVSRRAPQRARLARKQAEAIARAPLRVIRREAIKRGSFDFGGPRWEQAFGRAYSRHGFPF